MLIQYAIKNILIGAFIIFGFLIPSKEGIPSQTLKQTGQQNNLDFKTTPSVSPPYRGRLSGGLFECSLDHPEWNRVDANIFSDCVIRRWRSVDAILPLDCIPARLGGNRVDATDSLRPDSTLRKPIDKKFRMKKSPWVAVGLSALLPGAGQFYNKSYWKVPVVLGLVGYFAYEFYDNDKKYRDYRDQYSNTQTPENPAGDENLKALREFYFNQRNDFVWYFTIIYVINLVDAYVDAHLFDFDVREEKLTRFGTTDKEYRLNVKVNF